MSSPGNDQRSGSIPYIKVSDIRGLKVNVVPDKPCPRKRSAAVVAWGFERVGGVG